MTEEDFDPAAEMPIVVTESLVESQIREYAEDWHNYATVYAEMIDLFNRSPTMTVGIVRGVPTITVTEMLTALKRRLPDLQAMLDETIVMLLATIFSLKTGAIITQQFILVDAEFALLMAVLEEEGCF